MEVGSIVERYRDLEGEPRYMREGDMADKFVPYVVSNILGDKFQYEDVVVYNPIQLEEFPEVVYNSDYFREILPPQKVDIAKLLPSPLEKYSIPVSPIPELSKTRYPV